MLRRIFLIGVLVSSTFIWGTAQEVNLDPVRNFTISDGLAHNGVTSIIQDARGYFWASTYDGLSRYDGYSFNTIKNSIHREYFVSNRIRTIHEDTKGRLWLGTDGGVSVYDYGRNEFHKVYTNNNDVDQDRGPVVRKILDAGNGLLLCATEGDGLLLFNDEFELVKHYKSDSEEFGKGILFLDGIVFNDGFLFSTSVGLVEFELVTGDFIHHLQDEISYSNTLVALDNEHYLVDKNAGMSILKEENGSFKVVREMYDQFRFRDFALDQKGNLWIGTFNKGLINIRNVDGLILGEELDVSIFDFETDVLRTSAIYPSDDKGCWLATYSHGIYRFDLDQNPFKFLSADTNNPQSILSNEIGSLSVYDKDRVLISANLGGIAMLNTNRGVFEDRPFSNNNYPGGIVFADSRKRIWARFSGYGGFKIISSDEKINFQIRENGLNNIQLQTMYEDDFGNIWLGCWDNVYRLKFSETGGVLSIQSLKKNTFFDKETIFRVRDMYVDPGGNYGWIATQNGGLLRIDLSKDASIESAEVHQFLRDRNDATSISSNFVTSILSLNDDLWIGTEGGGFCRLVNAQSSKPTFIPITEENGLSNDVVKAIEADDAGDLWISTNHGLSRYNPEMKSFQNFYKADGLPFEDFVYPSVRLDNGKIVFSGSIGIFYFDPSDISVTRSIPKIQFDNLRINGKLVNARDSINGRIVIEKQLGTVDELNLKYYENVLSIDLVSLHYGNPINYQIKYRLDALGEEWIMASSNQQTINYQGLQPGEYTLKVMASNSLNDWSEEKELAIIISPPYWQTTVAYVLYVILAGLFVCLVIFIVLKIQSLNHKIQLEHLEAETTNKINGAKLRYFSNISHEIKTPITLISGPIEYLKNKLDSSDDVRGKLEMMQRQCKKITQLVDQVHDFQRSDANLLQLEFSHFSFNDLVKDTMKDFEFTAKADDKKLFIEAPDEPIYVFADREKFEKVLNNLLSNAFKFTQSGDSISISFSSYGKSLYAVVKDTGKGIDENEVDRIFDRFYQVRESRKEYSGGAGIGLAFTKRLVDMHYGFIRAESKKGQGTEIHLRLPIVDQNEPKEQEARKSRVLEAEENATDDLNLDKRVLKEIQITEETRNSRVFLVEDNPDMRTFLEDVLSEFFHVKSFPNGKECLLAMEDEWPELLISDVMMPEMNGFDLCKAVKTNVKTSHIPVIILTAFAAVDDQIQGVEVGADSYIQKPFDVKHLVKRIEALLESRRKLRARFQMNFPLVLEGEVDGNDAVFLEKLYSLLDENLSNEDIDINSFAKDLYLNRSYFFKKVKALTDQTPFELLKHYRLKKAAEMLKLGKVSVKEVFIETGFKSRTHFSKSFKEYFGKSPGQYASMSDAAEDTN